MHLTPPPALALCLTSQKGSARVCEMNRLITYDLRSRRRWVCQITIKFLFFFLQIFTGISHINATSHYLLMVLGKKLNMKPIEFAMSKKFLVRFSVLASAQWPQPFWDPKLKATRQSSEALREVLTLTALPSNPFHSHTGRAQKN